MKPTHIHLGYLFLSLLGLLRFRYLIKNKRKLTRLPPPPPNNTMFLFGKETSNRRPNILHLRFNAINNRDNSLENKTINGNVKPLSITDNRRRLINYLVFDIVDSKHRVLIRSIVTVSNDNTLM